MIVKKQFIIFKFFYFVHKIHEKKYLEYVNHSNAIFCVFYFSPVSSIFFQYWIQIFYYLTILGRFFLWKENANFILRYVCCKVGKFKSFCLIAI